MAMRRYAVPFFLTLLLLSLILMVAVPFYVATQNQERRDFIGEVSQPLSAELYELQKSRDRLILESREIILGHGGEDYGEARLEAVLALSRIERLLPQFPADVRTHVTEATSAVEEELRALDDQLHQAAVGGVPPPTLIAQNEQLEEAGRGRLDGAHQVAERVQTDKRTELSRAERRIRTGLPVLAVVGLASAGLVVTMLVGSLRRASRYTVEVTNTDNVLVVQEDAAGRLRVFNEGAEQISGYRAEDLAKTHWFQRLIPRDYHDLLETHHGGQFEAPLKTVSGQVKHVLWRTKDLGREGRLWIGVDVSDRRKAELALREQALYDPLTGLPNRRLFMDRLRQALRAIKREQRQVAVLFADLDGFKRVNDEAGHAAGDEVLRQVGVRIGEIIRPGDTAARVGGDEFVVLLPAMDSAQEAAEVAKRIARRLARPFIVDGSTYKVSASVGVTVAATDRDGDELVREADRAMYRAKQLGKNRVVLYSPELSLTPVEEASNGSEPPKKRARRPIGAV